MEKLSIKLENCYGIKHFKPSDFDFSEGSTYVIYASNGTMKTSLANTFLDKSKGKDPKKRRFGEEIICKIFKKDDKENKKEISQEDIFVIESAPQDKGIIEEKSTTLLVSPKLRKEYQGIHKEIDDLKKALFTKLKKFSGLSKEENIEQEISSIFSEQEDFFDAVESISKEIGKKKYHGLSDISYKKIFGDEKIVKILEEESFQEKIEKYIAKINELIEKSVYLRDDFNHSNIATIEKALEKNNYFNAKHSINLKDADGSLIKEVSSSDEFNKIINDEIDKIFNNSDLKEVFEIIDKEFTGTKYKEKFRKYLRKNEKRVVPELENPELFRKKLWISYIRESDQQWSDMLNLYKSKKNDINSILQKAEQEKTKWERCIDQFNRRFSVPFEVVHGNKKDSVVGRSSPSLIFIFKDRYSNKKPLDTSKDDLYSFLSSGEKRVLYLLDIIFEIEHRKEEGKETLLIMDDVIDSFDYKNKYAIISYLKEISEYENFYQIILTHNFDFFRIMRRTETADSKFFKMVDIDNEGTIKLPKAGFISSNDDPFKRWKEEIKNGDLKSFIASIPFVRNLIEYTGSTDDYNNLTKILHIKGGSVSITKDMLDSIYKKFDIDLDKVDTKKRPLIDTVFNLAKDIKPSGGINLKDKVILSIAVRLKAEQYVISEISGQKEFDRKQTDKLIEQFKKEFKDDNSKDGALLRSGIHQSSEGRVAVLCCYLFCRSSFTNESEEGNDKTSSRIIITYLHSNVHHN